MQVVYERCCGIDVHKQTVVACAIVPGADGQAAEGNPHLCDVDRGPGGIGGLVGGAGRHARGDGEHRGVLEAGVQPAGRPVRHPGGQRRAHQALAGRKTDVQDAEWIADLLRHGLLKGSFIPSEVLRELRDLTRYRTKLGDERKSEVNRVQKVLEDANIKLASVASDVMGVSGRAMLAELVKGQTDAATLAELAKGRLREKQDLLAEGAERAGAAASSLHVGPASEPHRLPR